jgi:hypothetical protein
MYTEKSKKITFAQVKKKLSKKIEEKLKGKYGSKRELSELKAAMAQADNWQLNSVCKQLVELNDAMLKGRSVFAICQKYPKGNLDTGRHYYSVHFVNKQGVLDKVWGYDYYSVIGQESQDRDRNLDKYIFASGAIGMSRLLDATDGLFSTLRSLGGCYAQIDCQ